jgi:hypothetical protein
LQEKQPQQCAEPSFQKPAQLLKQRQQPQLQHEQHSTARQQLHHQTQQSDKRNTVPTQDNGNTNNSNQALRRTSGWAASCRMHEMLLAQQRKREQYWMSKYGKLLIPSGIPSVGKPCANPKNLYK